MPFDDLLSPKIIDQKKKQFECTVMLEEGYLPKLYFMIMSHDVCVDTKSKKIFFFTKNFYF